MFPMIDSATFVIKVHNAEDDTIAWVLLYLHKNTIASTRQHQFYVAHL